MNQNDKLLVSLLNLHSSGANSIHSACDDSGHLSIFVTLARKKVCRKRIMYSVNKIGVVLK